ncbi:MAG: hypothetical protein V1725_04130 [archaeon]
MADNILNDYDIVHVHGSVPSGEYHAPQYYLDRRENHGFGFHCHLMHRNSRRYERSGYVVTIANNTVIAVPHAEPGRKKKGKNKPAFNLQDCKKAVLEEIRPLINEYLAVQYEKQPESMLKPNTECIELFKLD